MVQKKIEIEQRGTKGQQPTVTRSTGVCTLGCKSRVVCCHFRGFQKDVAFEFRVLDVPVVCDLKEWKMTVCAGGCPAKCRSMVWVHIFHPFLVRLPPT